MLFMKNIHQKFLSFLSSSLSTSLLVLGLINFVSLSLLLFLSPIYGAFWLLLATFFFLFKGDYKNIFIVWGIFFITWYLFFIFLLFGFESQILIGGEHTTKILIYLCDKYSIYKASWYTHLFQSFGLQTVFLLDHLSSILGFPIHIPSVV